MSLTNLRYHYWRPIAGLIVAMGLLLFLLGRMGGAPLEYPGR